MMYDEHGCVGYRRELVIDIVGAFLIILFIRRTGCVDDLVTLAGRTRFQQYNVACSDPTSWDVSFRIQNVGVSNGWADDPSARRTGLYLGYGAQIDTAVNGRCCFATLCMHRRSPYGGPQFTHRLLFSEVGAFIRAFVVWGTLIGKRLC